MTTRRGWLAVVMPLAAAMGCDEKEPLDPELGKVRPAAPVESAAGQRTSYVVAEQSAVTVSFGGKAEDLEGRFSSVTGRLDVELTNLSQARGTFAVDLMSARFSRSAPDERDLTREAINWLGLGADRPKAEREFRRLATATVFAVESLEQPAAHAGKLVRTSKNDESADAEEKPEYAELRKVKMTARVELTINARRATLEVPVTATFRFTEPALTGMPPDRIVIETQRPVSIQLPVFDIVPRDSRGTVLSNQRADALGALRGRARVQARLILERSG